jgi:hypothetical protein
MSKRIIISEEDKKEILKKYGLITEWFDNEDLKWFEDKMFSLKIDGNTNLLKIQNIDSDRNTEGKFYIYTKVARTGERQGVKLFNDPNKSFCYDCEFKDELRRYKDGVCLNSEVYSQEDVKSTDLKSPSDFLDNLYNKLCVHSD